MFFRCRWTTDFFLLIHIYFRWTTHSTCIFAETAGAPFRLHQCITKGKTSKLLVGWLVCDGNRRQKKYGLKVGTSISFFSDNFFPRKHSLNIKQKISILQKISSKHSVNVSLHVKTLILIVFVKFEKYLIVLCLKSCVYITRYFNTIISIKIIKINIINHIFYFKFINMLPVFNLVH